MTQLQSPLIQARLDDAIERYNAAVRAYNLLPSIKTAATYMTRLNILGAVAEEAGGSHLLRFEGDPENRQMYEGLRLARRATENE